MNEVRTRKAPFRRGVHVTTVGGYDKRAATVLSCVRALSGVWRVIIETPDGVLFFQHPRKLKAVIDPPKSAAQVAGGVARARKLSAAKRSEIARNAARKRWNKKETA